MSVHASSIGWKYEIPESIPKRQKASIKLVLLKLCDNANDNGYCWPSIMRISKETGLSSRNVIKQITCLEKLNLVKRVERYENTRQISNGYWLNIQRLKEGAVELPEEPENPSNPNPFSNQKNESQPVDNSGYTPVPKSGGGDLRTGEGCPQDRGGVSSNQTEPSMNHHRNTHTEECLNFERQKDHDDHPPVLVSFKDLDDDDPQLWAKAGFEKFGFEKNEMVFVWGKFVRYYAAKNKACTLDEVTALWTNWLANETRAKKKSQSENSTKHQAPERAQAFYGYVESQNSHDFANPYPSAKRMELGPAELQMLKQGNIPYRLRTWEPEEISEVKKQHGIEA